MEKTNKEIIKKYNGKVEITFYPNSHRYKLAGRKNYLISVTGATGMKDKSRHLMIWASRLCKSFLYDYLEKIKSDSISINELYPVIDEAVVRYDAERDEAATFGDMVHDWIESFSRAKVERKKEPEIPDDAPIEVIKGITAFLDWYNKNKVKFIKSEELIYSMEHEYVGKLDAIATVNGKHTLLDYKTGKGVYTEAYYQEAGYKNAYEEEYKEKIDQQLIIHIDKETGKFEVIERTESDYEKDLPVFLALLKVKRREKELNKWSK